MRARRQRVNRSDYLSDALTVLSEWTRDGVKPTRVHSRLIGGLGGRPITVATDALTRPDSPASGKAATASVETAPSDARCISRLRCSTS